MVPRQAKTRTSTATAAAVLESPNVLELPPPRDSGGMPLISALKLRHSTREYSDRPISEQVLSDLLWAAFGINRPSGDRTAPYWRHVMVIDLYLALADGVWIYEPKAHTLRRHLPDDIRAQTGHQDFVATAPLNLIYVAHGERMMDISQRSGVCMPPLMPHSSAKMFICSVLRKGLPAYFAEPLTIRSSREHCDCLISSS